MNYYFLDYYLITDAAGHSDTVHLYYSSVEVGRKHTWRQLRVRALLRSLSSSLTGEQGFQLCSHKIPAFKGNRTSDHLIDRWNLYPLSHHSHIGGRWTDRGGRVERRGASRDPCKRRRKHTAWYGSRDKMARTSSMQSSQASLYLVTMLPTRELLRERGG